MKKEKWTLEKYKKMVRDIKTDLRNEEEVVSGEGLYDIAESILDSEIGLKDFIIINLGAKDYIGRLAGDIS